MARTLHPARVDAGARDPARTPRRRLIRRDGRVVGARASVTRPDGATGAVTIRADHVFVCGGAIQTPTLLQHSGIRRQIGNGLKFHPTVKVAARFPRRTTTTTCRCTASPSSRRSSRSVVRPAGAARSRSRSPTRAARLDAALDDWENVVVYYAAIRSDGSGRVIALPGLNAPLVTYR